MKSLLQYPGVPLVISAPSGGGKTTLCHRLENEFSTVTYSISHTTRELRGDERHGIDYYFVSDKTFDHMVQKNEFLEWAKVHGKKYGTARAPVMKSLSEGKDVLFDIDIQGGKQIAQQLSEAVLIFIVPPNMQVLEQRLRNRKSDSESSIALRLAAAKKEIGAAHFYPYWIVNDTLDKAYSELRSVLVSQRLLRRNRKQLAGQVLGRSPAS